MSGGNGKPAGRIGRRLGRRPGVLPRLLRKDEGEPSVAVGLDEPLIVKATGLPSVWALTLAAQELEDRSLTSRRPVAVARFRLDRVLEAGDELRAEIASRAQVPLRAYDRLYDLLAGEFALLLPGAEAADAVPLVSKIQMEVGRLPLSEGGSVGLLAGISSSLEGDHFLYEWVRTRAEQGLDDAEDRGGLVVVPTFQRELFGAD